MVKQTCEKCGREIDSRGMRMHLASCKGKETVEQVEQNQVAEEQTEVVQVVQDVQKDVQTDKKKDVQTMEKVEEVILKPEKEVEQKAEKDEFNSCGECGQTFKGYPNYCPKCGCNFA